MYAKPSRTSTIQSSKSTSAIQNGSIYLHPRLNTTRSTHTPTADSCPPTSGPNALMNVYRLGR